MNIVPSDHLIGPHSNTYRLPLQKDSGPTLTAQEFEDNVEALVQYIKYFSTSRFYLSLDEFPIAYHVYLTPLLSIKNVKMG